jgi:hypothetical protein
MKKNKKGGYLVALHSDDILTQLVTKKAGRKYARKFAKVLQKALGVNVTVILLGSNDAIRVEELR